MAGTGKNPEETGFRRLWGILLIPLSLFLALSLFSYDWQDISLLKAPPNATPNNMIGPVGAWISFLLFSGFGVGAYFAPLVCLGMGLILIISHRQRVWTKVLLCLGAALTGVALLELRADWWQAAAGKLNILPDTTGLWGRILMRDFLLKGLKPVGTGILIWSLFLFLSIALIGWDTLKEWFGAAVRFSRLLKERIQAYILEHQDRRQLIEREERQLEKQRRRLERVIQKKEIDEPLPPAAEKTEDREPPEKETPRPPTEKAPRPRKPDPVPPPEMETVVQSSLGPYTLPPTSILQKIADGGGELKADTGTTAKILIETLSEFGIEAQVTNVEKGPVVTRYELLPAPGVRVERISSLSNNLALALKATSVRVQAPIPGKGVVGIEVPNTIAKMVFLREVLESPTWRSGKHIIPLVLGKDIGGSDLVADLANMPHLLVAGATGAGKTVCMNSILAGLLMSRTPDQLKLLLVDPKIVEFSVFNQLPHLIAPVITDPKKVTLGLRWAINEMEKRYKLFARVGVRNIESFNHREVVQQEELFGETAGEPAPTDAEPRTLPYIVIVIDELADLMLAAQADIENSIARLAQLSRAVGIHMIISTQRPSVNVITGTIKANFPARIAFQVAQKVDSRTILDTAGADKLLGRGDMLFLPPGSSKLLRAQGAMTTDEDVRTIVSFIKKQSQADYVSEIKEQIEKPAGSIDSGEDDEMLEQAMQIIRETRRASTSSLQRRLRIGYTRAARIIDILEERGILGPPRGSDPREILVDLDGEIPDNAPDAGTSTEES